jgi:uncharacterized protein YecT (DUF1311 family)
VSARLLLALALVVGGGFAARAADAPDCSKAQSQSEINECEDGIFRQADARLNRVYAQLAAKLDPDARKLLRDAERAWVDFRDKECESQTAGSAGGSIRPMYIAQCQTALTKRRIRELEAQRDCQTELCTLE